MKIDLLCNDGSPIGVTPPMIWGRGVGGAELAMMTLMEVFAGRGHDVSVYNDPQSPGVYEGVEYKPLANFDVRNKRDVLIVFRSPNVRYNPRFRGETTVVWWSTDQRTVGDFRKLAASVDYVVTISPYHTEYHKKTYRIPDDKIGHIDLGVRLEDYEGDVEKVENRLIYCSIPDRGLQELLVAWRKIKEQVVDASLVITSDYTLWGSPHPSNNQFRLAWARQNDVHFLGAVPRERLIEEQMKAEVQSYPCTYEELFCISAAECQVAGAVPVTSMAGALVTTNEFGVQIPGDPRSARFADHFADRVIALLSHERDYLENMKRTAMAGGATRFNWQSIAETWEELFEKGRL